MSLSPRLVELSAIQAGAWALACAMRLEPFVLALPYRAEAELYSAGIDLGMASLVHPVKQKVLAFQRDMQSLIDADEGSKADPAHQCLVTLAYALDAALPPEQTTIRYDVPIVRVADDSEQAWETLDYAMSIANAKAQGRQNSTPEVQDDNSQGTYQNRELRAQAETLDFVISTSPQQLLEWLQNQRTNLEERVAEMRSFIAKYHADSLG